MDYLQYTQEIARLARENETYLAHHGIKGQKHGERRYQYEDGSLTPLGRQHYGVGDGDDRQSSKPKPPAQRRRTSSTTKTKAQLEQELAEARAEAEKQRTHKKVAIGLGIAGTAAATIAAVILGKKLKDKTIELDSVKQAAAEGAEKLKTMQSLNDKLKQDGEKAFANLKAMDAENKKLSSALDDSLQKTSQAQKELQFKKEELKETDAARKKDQQSYNESVETWRKSNEQLKKQADFNLARAHAAENKYVTEKASHKNTALKIESEKVRREQAERNFGAELTRKNNAINKQQQEIMAYKVTEDTINEMRKKNPVFNSWMKKMIPGWN